MANAQGGRRPPELRRMSEPTRSSGIILMIPSLILAAADIGVLREVWPVPVKSGLGQGERRPRKEDSA